VNRSVDAEEVGRNRVLQERVPNRLETLKIDGYGRIRLE
jgi:hypothetical protein